MNDNDQDYLDEDTEDQERPLTYEEVLAILEEELIIQDPDNPYQPLNFHDPDESF